MADKAKHDVVSKTLIRGEISHYTLQAPHICGLCQNSINIYTELKSLFLHNYFNLEIDVGDYITRLQISRNNPLQTCCKKDFKHLNEID